MTSTPYACRFDMRPSIRLSEGVGLSASLHYYYQFFWQDDAASGKDNILVKARMEERSRKRKHAHVPTAMGLKSRTERHTRRMTPAATTLFKIAPRILEASAIQNCARSCDSGRNPG